MTIAVLHSWQVDSAHIPHAIARMGFHRIRLRAVRHLRFWKLLGTGRGETFTLSDADSRHWTLLTVWDDLDTAQDFLNSAIVKSWNSIAIESGVVIMRPVSSHGEWSGKTPFAVAPEKVSPTQPIAVITRARIKLRFWKTFNQSVPPVSNDLLSRRELLVKFGIGEAPLGLQGTFSVWENSVAIRDFAYKSEAHKKVIADTHRLAWYSEELFARFAIVEVHGSIQGVALITLMSNQ